MKIFGIKGFLLNKRQNLIRILLLRTKVQNKVAILSTLISIKVAHMQVAKQGLRNSKKKRRKQTKMVTLIVKRREMLLRMIVRIKK